MKIQHFGKGISFNDAEATLLGRKIQKLVRYCNTVKDEGSILRLDTERRTTEKARDQVKVMLTVQLPRKTMRAESRRARILDALDRAIEKITPQIKKYKEMQTGKERARR